MIYKDIPMMKPYAINRYGVIINKTTGEVLKQYKNNSGYYTVNIKPIGFKRISCFVHRLVCLTYKPTTNLKLHVNHKDLNCTNNYYRNLEWCTPRENNTYSAYHNDNFKQTPIYARNIYTKIIKQYDSIYTCAKDIGISRDAVIYRLNSMFGSIFDGYQFKRVNDSRAWIELDNIEILSKQKVYKKMIYLKKNGIAREFETQREAAKFLMVSETTMNKFIKLRHKFSFNGYTICKRYDSNWDAQLPEWYNYLNPRYIITTNGVLHKFYSLREMSIYLEIPISTLLYKLQRTVSNKLIIGSNEIEIQS